MRAGRLMPVLMSVAGLALVARPASADEFPMESSLVDTGFIYYYDLAVDAAGNAHAFIDETGIDKLYYSNNVGGSWGTPEFVANTSDWGTINVSGAVDALGVAHIALDTGPGGGQPVDIMTYATNDGGSWSILQLRNYSRWYSLDLSPTGLPRISYYYDYEGLCYAIMLFGRSWMHENVDSTGGVTTYAGRYSDLVVDANDYGHIVYYNYTTDAIRYATNSSGSWQWEEVVTGPDSRHAKIALDSDGNPLVAYAADDRIYAARRHDDNWDVVTVAKVGNYGYFDVKADENNNVCVVYNDYDDSQLKLAIESAGTFTHYEIFDVLAGGYGPVLHVHGRTIHVLAWNQTTEELYHLVGDVPPPGDLNGDGCVNLADLGIMLATYGLCPGDEGYNPVANLVENDPPDGCIDLADLGVLLAHYGEGCP